MADSNRYADDVNPERTGNDPYGDFLGLDAQGSQQNDDPYGDFLGLDSQMQEQSDAYTGEDDWAFTKGVKAGYEQTKGLAGALGALLGETVDSDWLRQKGIDVYQSSMERAGEIQRTTESDITQIDGFGEAAEYLGYTLGNVLTQFAPTVIAGGLGGALGRKMTLKAAEELLEKEVAKGASLEVAKEAVEAKIKKGEWLGAGAGAYGSGTALQTGEYGGQIFDETGRLEPGIAAGFGVLGGALEAFAPLRALERAGLGKKFIEDLGKSRLMDVVRSAGAEAGTEGLQTILGEYAIQWADENYEAFGEDFYNEFINAVAAGAIGGGAMQTAANLGEGAFQVDRDRIADDAQGRILSRDRDPAPGVTEEDFRQAEASGDAFVAAEAEAGINQDDFFGPRQQEVQRRDQEREARRQDLDARAEQAAQEVAAQGGDALAQVQARQEVIAEGEAIIDAEVPPVSPQERQAAEAERSSLEEQAKQDQDALDQTAEDLGVTFPDATDYGDTTRPRGPVADDSTDAVSDAIAEADAFGDQQKAMRLRNAQRMEATGNRMIAEGRSDAGSRMIERAQRIYADYGLANPIVPFDPANAVEQAEQVQGAAPPRETQTFTQEQGRLPPARQQGEIGPDGVIYGQVPPEQRQREQQQANERDIRTIFDRRAREGSFPREFGRQRDERAWQEEQSYREVGLDARPQGMPIRPQEEPAPDSESPAPLTDEERQLRQQREELAADAQQMERDMPAPPKGNQRAADVDMELQQAIASAGGLNRAEAEAQGIDPADFNRRAGGIRRVFTKQGKTFDEMAEHLAELGFFDARGDYSPNTLMEMLTDSLGGRGVYSPRSTVQSERAGLQQGIDDNQAEIAAIDRRLAELEADKARSDNELAPIEDDQLRELGYAVLEADALGLPRGEVDALINQAPSVEAAITAVEEAIANAKDQSGAGQRGRSQDQAVPRGEEAAREAGSEGSREEGSQVRREEQPSALTDGRLPNGYHIRLQDKGPFKGLRWRVERVDDKMDSIGNWEDSPEAAATKALDALELRKQNSAAAAEARAAQDRVADKILRGESPTKEDWLSTGLVDEWQYDRGFVYQRDISGFLVDKFGLPRNNIQKNLGRAGGYLTNSNNVKKPIVRLNQLADVLKQQGDPLETSEAVNPPFAEEQQDAFGGNEGQALADAARRKDEKRSPPKDVPADIDGGLFSNQQQQTDLEDAPEGQQEEGAPEASSDDTGPDVEPEKPKPEGQPITDFGEKIKGARKDYAALLEAAKDVDTATAPLSKSWPEPKYQKMLDEGVPSKVVSTIRAMRDEIPTKPKKRWKVKGWVEQVEALRGFAEDILSGKHDVNYVLDRMRTDLKQNPVVGRIDLYEEFGHDVSLKGIRFGSNHYSLYKGEKDVTKWTVEGKPTSTAMSRWPRELAVGDTKEDALEAFRPVHEQMKSGGGKGRAVSFSIYSDRVTKDVFIGKKIGRNVIRVQEGFASSKEAREYRDANQQALEDKLRRMRDLPPMRRESNEPRVGEDHRNGADVTPEVFSETFGFRGVQFGNYVEQGRRQEDLNNAYDAFMDLAAIIGVSPKALSLGGELGLAFGARGKGGKRPASAHYETAHTVINLTKRSGAGSLAHEWFHALDNYITRERGSLSGGDFATAMSRQTPEHVRPELFRAFRSLMGTIKTSTNLEGRSRVLDQTRSSPYWSQSLEMAARSFESYVIAKLRDQNASNDYLANIISSDAWDAFAESMEAAQEGFPYLLAEEEEPVRAAFDHLFATIEERKEGDRVILFRADVGEVRSRSARYGRAVSPAQGDLLAGLDPEADPYVEAETRPDTRPEQKEAGRSALRDLFRLLDSFARRRWPAGGDEGKAGAVSLLGARLYKDFQAGRPAQLIGQQASSPADFAAIAQVYRDPRFETFRVVMTKGDEVVGEYASTSRLPAAVRFGDVDEYVQNIKDRMRDTGADGYYLLHNHPSGTANPSRSDINFTTALNSRVPGLRQHVIIDHNEYSVIEPDGQFDVIPDSTLNAIDFSSRPEQPHDVLGKQINGPADVGRIANSVADDSRPVIVMTTTQGEVNLVTSVPREMLELFSEDRPRPDRLKAIAALRRISRASGSGGRAFVVLPKGETSMIPYRSAMGFAADIVTADGMQTLSGSNLSFGRNNTGQRMPVEDVYVSPSRGPISPRRLDIEEELARYETTEGGFYSSLERKIAEANIPGLKPSKRNPSGAIRGEAWLQYLRNRSIKQEEWLWTGMRQFLSENARTRFTRDELLDEARRRRVGLGDIVKGINPDSRPTVAVSRSPVEWLDRASEQELDEFVAAMTGGSNPVVREAIQRGDIEVQQSAILFNGNDTNYYAVGADGYGWGVVTVDSFGEWRAEEMAVESRNEAEVRARQMAETELEDSSEWSSDPDMPQWEEYVDPGEYADYHELLVTLPGNDFDSVAHFRETGIVGFVRADMRDEGTRYHIEELQSDLHQKGRESGYSDPAELSALEALVERAGEEERAARAALVAGLKDTVDALDRAGLDRTDVIIAISNMEDRVVEYPRETSSYLESANDVNERWVRHQLAGSLLDADALESGGGLEGLSTVMDEVVVPLVPLFKSVKSAMDKRTSAREALHRASKLPADSPFKNDAWISLMAKRALTEAARRGADWVSWPTASMVIRRWSDDSAELYQNIYDKKLPAIMRRLTQGEKPFKEVEISSDRRGDPLGVESWQVRLDQALREQILSEGMPMFRASEDGGSTVEQVRAWADELDLNVPYRVITRDEIPADVQDMMRRDGVKSLSGWYTRGPNGGIVLVAEGIRSKRAAQITLLHEAVGHMGVEQVMGAQMDEFLKLVQDARGRDEVIDSFYREVERGYPDAPDVIKAAEVVAHMAERDPKHTLVQRVIQWFRQALRKMGFSVMFTSDDIVEVIRRARASVQSGRRQNGADGILFRQDGDQTQTPEFKRWFGDSKVVDENGEPLVVYHGTQSDFSEFDPLKTGTASDAGWYGNGFYFTPDAEVASDAYARQQGGANVMPAYLSIKNPYDWRSENERGLFQSDQGEALRKRAELEARGFDGVAVYDDYIQLPEGQKLTDEQWAMLKGTPAEILGRERVEQSLSRREWDYSVLSHNYGRDFAQTLPKSRRVLREVVAFRPNQIKSAIGNRGTFDPESDNILFRAAEDEREAMNARMREEHQGIVYQAKRNARRYLKPGGLLPKSVFEEKIRRDSSVSAGELDIRRMVLTLEHTWEKAFKQRFTARSEEQNAMLDRALRGDTEAVAELPTKVAAAVEEMRQHIDRLSGKYIGILERQARELMSGLPEARQQELMQKIADEDFDGLTKEEAQIAQKVSLMQTIAGNQGRYMHRSYRAFDDPQWPKKVPSSILNAARDYLEGRYLEDNPDATEAEAARRADQIIEDILKVGTAYDSMEAYIKESKLGAKDLSVLKQRKQIAPEIRALLGEHRDPRLNFARTVTKMNQLIFNTGFLERLKDIGMGSFLFEDGDQPPGAHVTIAAEGSEIYSPLNGLRTFPDIELALRDAMGRENMNALWKSIVKMNGIVKYGKAQPLTATVYTPAGPAKMGDLKVGDMVLGANGPTAVTGVFPQGEMEVFRIKLSDGAEIEATREHLWEVDITGASKPRVMTTEELMSLPSYRIRKRQVALPVAVAQFDGQDVPIDPYVMGALLGDGSMRASVVRFSSVDEPILARVGSALPAQHIIHRPKSWAACDYAIVSRGVKDNQVRLELAKMGLWGKLSQHKFIPDIYKYNSPEVRMELVRGLLDTDGWVARDGQPALSVSSERMARDFAWVVDSLGMSAWLSSKKTTGLDSFTVKVRCDNAADLFHLDRKKAKCRPRKKPVKRSIVSIEPAGRTEPCQCISVADERHLYFTDGLALTHNTVLSPTTAARNFMSAYFFTLANGHFNLGQLLKSIKATPTYFRERGGAAGYMRRLKELGVVYDTPYAGEMIRLLNDADMADSLVGNRDMGIKQAMHVAQRFYQWGDDFWKIMGFENEVQLQMKHAKLSREEAEVKAAYRIRNTYPTYSMVGKLVNHLRRFPLAGTFVSFPAEIVRTSGNIVRFAAEDMKTSPALGMRRLAGIGIVGAFAHVAQEMFKDMLGVDDDEEEAIREHLAPWNENSNLLFLDRDADGKVRFLDISFLDPYNYWKRPLNAIMRDEPWEEEAKDVVKETLSPFLGQDILFGSLMEVFMNEKSSGGQVYNEADKLPDQAADIAGHLQKAVQPGLAANIQKTLRAARGEVSRSGLEYSLRDELAAWAGFRVSTIDPKVSLVYRTYDINDTLSAARSKVTRLATDPNPVSDDELLQALQRSIEIRLEAYGDLLGLIDGAKTAGLSNQDVVQQLISAGVAKKDAFVLAQGRVPMKVPSNQWMSSAIRSARSRFGEETQREFLRRRQFLRSKYAEEFKRQIQATALNKKVS